MISQFAPQQNGSERESSETRLINRNECGEREMKIAAGKGEYQTRRRAATQPDSNRDGGRKMSGSRIPARRNLLVLLVLLDAFCTQVGISQGANHGKKRGLLRILSRIRFPGLLLGMRRGNFSTLAGRVEH